MPKSILQQMQAHIEQLKAQRSALMQERSQLAERGETLMRMPLAKADVLQFAMAYIDQQARQYLESDALSGFIGKASNPGPQLYRETKGPLTLRDYDTALSGSSGLVHVFGMNAEPLPFTGPNTSLWRINQAAAFYFGDTIKAKIAQHFDAFYLEPEDDAGELPAIGQRREELAAIVRRTAEIDSEIGVIDTELQQVRDSTDTTTQEQRAAQSAVVKLDDFRKKVHEIYRLANGSNTDDLARRFRISVRLVKAITSRTDPNLSDAEAKALLNL